MNEMTLSGRSAQHTAEEQDLSSLSFIESVIARSTESVFNLENEVLHTAAPAVNAYEREYSFVEMMQNEPLARIWRVGEGDSSYMTVSNGMESEGQQGGLPILRLWNHEDGQAQSEGTGPRLAHEMRLEESGELFIHPTGRGFALITEDSSMAGVYQISGNQFLSQVSFLAPADQAIQSISFGDQDEVIIRGSAGSTWAVGTTVRGIVALSNENEIALEIAA